MKRARESAISVDDPDFPPNVAPRSIEQDLLTGPRFHLTQTNAFNRIDEVNKNWGYTADPELENMLSNLTLRKIIKLNTPPGTAQMQFCSGISGGIDMRNALMICADDQLHVFDNEHVGDHLDLYVHFKNDTTDHVKGGKILSSQWLRCATDSLAAIGCEDNLVQVVSLGHQRVIRVLRGHTAPVTALCDHPGVDRLLVSADEHCVRVWDWFKGVCIAEYNELSGTTALAVDRAGQSVVVGNKSGHLNVIDLAPVLAKLKEMLAASGKKPVAMLEGSSVPFRKEQGRVEDIKFMPANASIANRTVVAARFSTGHIHLWDLPTTEKLVEYHVELPAGPACRMSFNPDGAYLVTGNNCGQIFVYAVVRDLTAQPRKNVPAPLTVLKHPKIKGAVTDACFNPRTSKSIVYATQDGYIWRWDYRSQADQNKPEEEHVIDEVEEVSE